MSISTLPELRWGILGCARITRRGLAPGIASSQSGSLHALASRDGDQARAWAEEFGVPRAYGSYEALLADPDVQAVYIPLPNELHRPWVIAAADAGKHVLCEKPLALDAADAAAMVDHCRARGVLLMEGFMWRHQPRTATLRERLAQGAIGELRLVRTSFSFPIAAGDWRRDPARGGGARCRHPRPTRHRHRGTTRRFAGHPRKLGRVLPAGGRLDSLRPRRAARQGHSDEERPRSLVRVRNHG